MPTFEHITVWTGATTQTEQVWTRIVGPGPRDTYRVRKVADGLPAPLVQVTHIDDDAGRRDYRLTSGDLIALPASVANPIVFEPFAEGPIAARLFGMKSQRLIWTDVIYE